MELFLHSFSPSPILADFGPFLIRWYGLCLALGALAGYLIVRRRAVQYGWSADAIMTLVFFVIIAGFFGARLYHVLNEPFYYWAHPGQILEVWKGGLAIHGALLAGIGTLWFFAKRWHLPLLRMTDVFVPGLAIGQAIGRWGNYFNQELFGKPTSLPWGIPIDAANRPAGYETASYFHPTFLYESLWALLVFGIVLLIHRRLRKNADGIVTWAYLLLASLGRIGTELLRLDDTPIIVGIRLPLLASSALVIVGGLGLWYGVRRFQKP